jgi:hypothetical protein
VDATAGDIVLTSVSARLRNTEILGQGTIQSQPGSKGKTEDINFTVKDGRVEDVLALFVKKEPPISGAISFKAHTRVPSEQGRFLKKVQLQGDFDIRQGLLMNTRTQHSVDTLSADARGAKDKKRAEEDPQRVFSSLGGHVDLKTGVADFKNLVFEVPGATAHMGGTFNVINEGVNLNGTLQLQAKLSNATSGIKSFLVKILDPFIKKNHSQAPLPVSITGTYDHPHYQVLLTKK